MRIEGGKGKDIIEKVGDNVLARSSVSTFTVKDGESLVTSYDEITGFDLGVAGSAYADRFDFTRASMVANGDVGRRKFRHYPVAQRDQRYHHI